MSFVDGPILTHDRSLSPIPSTPTRTFSEGDKENSVISSCPMPGRSGDVSPSSVCQQRRLSSAIVTTPESTHEYLCGRPTIVLPTFSPDVVVPRGPPPTDRKPPKLPKPQMIRRYCSVPVDMAPQEFLNSPAPLRLEAWTEPSGTSFQVRGPNYLYDGKKVASEPSAFRLLTVDLIQSDTALMGGLCSHPNERIQQALQREAQTGNRQLPAFIFAVNLAVPGPPCYHLVSYFGVDDIETIKTDKTPFGRVARKFFFGDCDKFRDETFKLIPRIVEGNFVVKKAVGSKPSILGKKLRQAYIRNERFMELIVDIGSDRVAQKIVKLSIGYARSLVVDMAFVLEGKEEECLPEQLVGGVRLRQIDFKNRDGQRMCYE